MNAEWTDLVREHARRLARANSWPVDPRNGYVVQGDWGKLLFWRPVQEAVRKLDICWHSPGNPTSSQIMAVDLVEGLAHTGGLRLLSIDHPVCLSYEWVDKRNDLRECGMKSHVDVMISSPAEVWLFEVKYREDQDQTCGTSVKTSVCANGGDSVISECPLSAAYGTRYMECIKDPNGPIDCDRFIQEYSDSRKCPMLRGEVHQLVRLVAMAWAKSKSGKPWHAGILYPSGNEFIEHEVTRFRTCLRHYDALRVSRLEDIIVSAKRTPTLIQWADYVEHRYLPESTRR